MPLRPPPGETPKKLPRIGPRPSTGGGGGSLAPWTPNPIVQRSTGLPKGFVADNPLTSAKLLTSSLPTNLLQDLYMKFLGNGGYDYIKAQNGTDGTFMTARAVALSYGDPTMRAAATHIVDTLQQAAHSNQMITVRGRSGGVGQLAAPKVRTFTLDGETVTVDPEKKTIVIPTRDQHSQTFVQSATIMHELFPDWTLSFPSGSPAWDSIHIATSSLMKGFDVAFTAPFAVLNQFTEHIPGGLGRQLRRASNDAQQGIGLTFARAEDLVGGGAEEVNRLIHGHWTIPGAVDPRTGQYDPKAFWFPRVPGHGMGNVATQEYNPNDPATAYRADLYDLVGQLALAKAGGEFFGGLKEGRVENIPEPGDPGYDQIVGRRMSLFRQMAFDVTHRTPAEIPETKAGARMFDRLWDIKQKYGRDAAAVMNRTFGDGKVPTQVANYLSTLDSKAEMADAWVKMAEGKDPRDIAKIEDRIGQIDETISKGQATAVVGPEEGVGTGRLTTGEIHRLLLEKKGLQSVLVKPFKEWTPIRNLPTTASLLKIAAKTDTPFARAYHAMYAKEGTFANVSDRLGRLTDMLGRTRIYNPFRADAPKDALELNKQVIQGYFHRAGVAQEKIDGLLSDMARMRHSQDFYQFMTHAGDVLKTGRHVSADMREELTKFYDRTPEARSYGHIVSRDGATTTSRPVLPKEGNPGEGLPKMTAEFIDHFDLRPIGTLVDATSLSRRWLREWSRTGGRVPVNIIRGAQTLNTWATTVSKFSILAPRILLGALIWRIQGEQALRGQIYGLPFWSRDGILDRIGLLKNDRNVTLEGATQGEVEQKVMDYLDSHEGYEPNKLPGYRREDILNNAGGLQARAARDLGIHSNPDGTWTVDMHLVRRDAAVMRRIREEVLAGKTDAGAITTAPDTPGDRSTSDNYQSTETMDRGALRDVAASMFYDDFAHLHQSEEMRKLIELNGNVTEWVKWLKENDRGKMVMDQFAPILEDSTVKTPRDFGTEMWKWIEQQTGKNERLLSAIRTGKLNRILPEQTGHTPVDEATWTRYQNLEMDLGTVREGLDNAFATDEPNMEAINALSRQRNKIIDEMHQIERKSFGKKAESIDLGDPILNGNLDKRSTSFGNRMRFIAELKKMADNGEYTPPPTVTGRYYGDLVTKAEAAGRQAHGRFYRAFTDPFSVLTKADLRWTRGSTLNKFAAEEYNRLRALGYSDKQAFGHALAHGSAQTRDLMYDLTEKSSFARAMRNWFWFLPAYQELLNTWFVKLPARDYWPIGAAVLYEKAHILNELAHQLGWIQTDPNTKKDIITIPFLGDWMAKTTGLPKGDIDKVYGYSSGLNMVTSGIAPYPSLQGTAIIDWLAKHDPNDTLLQGLHNQIHQFGPATTSLPAAFEYAWEMTTGKPSPLEFMHKDYVEAIANQGWDMAYQQAVAAVGAPPNIKAYPPTPAGERRFIAAAKAYYTETSNKATSIYKGWATLRLIGSLTSPMSLHVTDTYRQAWNTFYNDVLSKDKNNPTKWAQDIHNFNMAHPGSYAYTVGTSYETGKKVVEPPNVSVDQQIFDHARNVYTREDYPTYVMGRMSMDYINAGLDQVYRNAGSTGPQQIAHTGELRAATQAANNSKDQYLAWTDDIAHENGGRSYSDLLTQKEAVRKGLGEQSYVGWEAQKMINASHLLGELTSHFEAGGIRQAEFKSVVAQLNTVYDTLKSNPDASPAAKGKAWYWAKVEGPYLKQLDQMITLATDIQDAGGNPNPIWDKIRIFESGYTAKAQAGKLIGPDGLAYPDPQQAIWDSKTPAEQKQAKIHYAMLPTAWLSTFQRNIVGYSKAFPKLPEPQVNKVLQYAAGFDSMLTKFEAKTSYINASGTLSTSVSPQSKYGQALAAWRDKYLKVYAQNHGGADMVRLWTLADTGTPAQRLMALGYGKDNPTLQTLVRSANAAIQVLNKAGVSPAGNSATAIYERSWFHNQVSQALANDKNNALSNAFTELSLATPYKNSYLSGNALYDALFFDARPTTNYIQSAPWKGTIKGVTQGTGPHSVVRWENVYNNGYIPLGAMSNIGRGFYLQPVAANDFEQAMKAAQAQGINILADVTSAYRSYAKQANIVASGVHPAAAPGQSNHGWGLALDISKDTPGWRWMVTYGPKYGWEHRDPVGDPVHFTFEFAAGV